MNGNGNIKTLGELYPDPWLHASDLVGKRVTVKITAVELQEFHMPDNSTKLALAVSFEKAKKRLILNKTMARAMMAITGTEVFSEWVGASVVLAPGQAPNGRATIVVMAAELAVTPAQVARQAIGIETKEETT